MSNPKAKRAPPPQLNGELAVWTLRTAQDVNEWLSDPFDADDPFAPIHLILESKQMAKTETEPEYQRSPDFPHVSFAFWSHVSAENYKLHAEIEPK